MNLDSLNTSASSDGQAEMDLITMMMQMEEKLTDFNAQPPPPPPPSNYTNTPSTQPFYDAWSDATAAQMAAVASGDERRSSSVAAMREMIFHIAAMQPINLDPEAVRPPKRRNVRISKDPQSVAARHRRERISERIRILQRLVPGGTKMDTASMLDEAVHYVKFLKTQLQSLERAAAGRARAGFPPAAAMAAFANGSYSCTGRGYSAQDQGYMMNPSHHQMLS